MTLTACKSSTTNWFVTTVLLILLLMLLAGLYAFSGLPRPWASATPSAHEAASFQRFSVLASAIERIGEDATTNQRKDALEKAGASFSDTIGNFAEEELQLVEPMGSFGIVVVGQKQDRNGMIWAITRDGEVIKVSWIRGHHSMALR